MCGRYYFTAWEELQERYGLENHVSGQSNFNVAPSTNMPVIIRDNNTQANKLEIMRWGLVPKWVKDLATGSCVINARAETVNIKPTFRRLINSYRCLVPANGFYEWQHTTKKKRVPYLFKLKNNTLFSFAGLYDLWINPSGNIVKTYAIVTTSANRLMQEIHNRMPVILQPEDESIWLSTTSHEKTTLALLKQYPINDMEYYPISDKVNLPSNNSQDLLTPLA